MLYSYNIRWSNFSILLFELTFNSIHVIIAINKTTGTNDILENVFTEGFNSNHLVTNEV